MLIDSHCHLSFDKLHNNLKQIVENANNARVKGMLTVCTQKNDIEIILKIIKQNKNIWGSIGIHPLNTDQISVTEINQLAQYLENNKIIAIGETGLDFYHENYNKKHQIKCFIEHIKLSQQYQLPIIIHTRGAGTETIEILKSEMQNKKFPALIHCFTETQDFANKVLNLGLYISISGIITFKNAKDLQNIAKTIPTDKLLIETDAPFLAPMPHRGKTNEPSFIKHTADYLADILQISPADLAEQTSNNFFQLFNKVIRYD